MGRWLGEGPQGDIFQSKGVLSWSLLRRILWLMGTRAGIGIVDGPLVVDSASTGLV